MLERWDERNQAWADHTNAEPERPRGTGRLSLVLWVAATVFYVTRFVAAITTGAWVQAAFDAPFAGLLVWAVVWRVAEGRRRRSTT